MNHFKMIHDVAGSGRYRIQELKSNSLQFLVFGFEHSEFGVKFLIFFFDLFLLQFLALINPKTILQL